MISPKTLSLLLFSTPTKAGTTSMQNSINSLSALFDFSANPNPSTLTSSSRPSNRTLVQVLTGPEYASVFQNIDHYGCWCYFEENFTKGKGQPQDPIDELCKVLHDGYECAIMDGEADGYACAEPWLSDYSTSTVPASELQSDCRTRNQDPCAAHTCIVEGYSRVLRESTTDFSFLLEKCFFFAKKFFRALFIFFGLQHSLPFHPKYRTPLKS